MADWTNSPVMEDYRAALRRFAPNGVRGGLGPVAWTGGKLIERLAETFPPRPTTQSVLDALYGLRDETLGGRIPPTSYPRSRTKTSVPPCSVPLRIKNGRFVVLKGAEAFSCAPGWQPAGP